ncbi:MAG: glycosyltransferase, partial [Oscillospiraceae bacterium]|nr:glycosyltransferase [Oscillospiraceae bacterium]
MASSSSPVIYDTGHMSPPAPAEGLWENRENAYRVYDSPGVPKCTVAVIAYNRLAKTRYCVECILNHTSGVAFELLLIDNGSSDGTLEFFESVLYGNKKIIRITGNIGLGYAWRAARDHFSGKYLVIVSNDVYVTGGWLANLLKCYESDPRIGFVSPVSSNVSNFQQVDIPFSSYEEMQAKAAEYNQSDPLKWEERMRLISLIGIYSRPVLDIVGISDSAFLHDFTEDDLAARLRRSGYRLILCRDTWVCHDHDFRSLEDKDPYEFQESLKYGRAVFREKYHGLDAWDDILNFEFSLLSPLDAHPFAEEGVRCLVIDGRCGTPVLETRNRLKRRGIVTARVDAFTTNAKYYEDLLSVAGEVFCAPAQELGVIFEGGCYDAAVLCEPLNIYPAPFAVLKSLYGLLRPGGLLLFKLLSSESYHVF